MIRRTSRGPTGELNKRICDLSDKYTKLAEDYAALVEKSKEEVEEERMLREEVQELSDRVDMLRAHNAELKDRNQELRENVRDKEHEMDHCLNLLNERTRTNNNIRLDVLCYLVSHENPDPAHVDKLFGRTTPNKTIGVYRDAPDEPGKTCICCCERQARIVYLGCGHQVVCKECDQKIDKCPFCKVETENNFIDPYHNDG